MERGWSVGGACAEQRIASETIEWTLVPAGVRVEWSVLGESVLIGREGCQCCLLYPLALVLLLSCTSLCPCTYGTSLHPCTPVPTAVPLYPCTPVHPAAPQPSPLLYPSLPLTWPRPRRRDRRLADAVARALGGGSSDEERYTESGGAHCEVWFVWRW